jgi:hypothetical protein
MSLFTLDGADDWIQRHYADESDGDQDCPCPYCQRGIQDDGDYIRCRGDFETGVPQ